ncbi:copper resistance CopC/CopD family protein [Pelagibacterium lentulum]|uniref:Copper resistance protein C n=1 Tax=Pelagibacterium lentulum TaxID=2029865 RepID=A0A916R5B7_9HYPH|nr:copper resistance protein CopC [Pelagibacterium lentulum]GGA35211.1 copper resistance protein C [Pelagibacterium lentulum]
MTCLRFRLLAPILGLFLALLTQSGALAHAVLLSTAPSHNAVVAAAPQTVVLTFNEPVGAMAISLIAPDGVQRDLIDAATSGTDVEIVLPEDLDQGTHMISWRVMSGDGHPVGGTLVFSIGMPTGTPAEVTTTDPLVAGVIWASKTALYLALFLGLGSAIFGAFITPLSGWAQLATGTVIFVGLCATPVSIGLQGLDALGLDLADVLGARPWQTGLSTPYGSTASLLLVALSCAALSLVKANAITQKLLAGAAWLIVPLALVLSGHASTAQPQRLSRPAVFVHIGAILFWTGALLPLLLILQRPDGAAHALGRFSSLIPYSVVAILISGLILGFIQMGPDMDQWLSPYGYILVLKLGLLTILLGLAIWNRLVLTGPVLRGDVVSTGHMRKSISAEIILMVLILGLVAGWRFTPPPRALTLVESEPVSLHIHTSQAMADVAITPGQAGTNAVSIYLSDGDFLPIEPLEVALSFAAPEVGIEAIRATAQLESDGFWYAKDITLPVSGEWQVDLEIRLSRFELVRLNQAFTLP